MLPGVVSQKAYCFSSFVSGTWFPAALFVSLRNSTLGSNVALFRDSYWFRAYWWSSCGLLRNSVILSIIALISPTCWWSCLTSFDFRVSFPSGGHFSPVHACLGPSFPSNCVFQCAPSALWTLDENHLGGVLLLGHSLLVVTWTPPELKHFGVATQVSIA